MQISIVPLVASESVL